MEMKRKINHKMKSFISLRIDGMVEVWCLHHTRGYIAVLRVPEFMARGRPMAMSWH